jgi:lambda repressor-like predicted transcriptional regulator/AraC-like DNA-binding protein
VADNVPMRAKTHKKPLLSRHLDVVGLHDAAVARLCGLSRTNLARARYKHLGAENSELLSLCLARELGLSDEERLSLKAEVMGRPGNLVRAYFESIEDTVEAFGVSRHTALEILDPEQEINGNNAAQIIERLGWGDVPAFVAEDISSRIGPPPKGRLTHRARGLEGRNERARTLWAFSWGKPETARAIRESGLSRKELRERAGIGRETLRKALYDRCGNKAASAIADVLGEALSLPEEREEAIRRELANPLQTSF